MMWIPLVTLAMLGVWGRCRGGPSFKPADGDDHTTGGRSPCRCRRRVWDVGGRVGGRAPSRLSASRP